MKKFLLLHEDSLSYQFELLKDECIYVLKKLFLKTYISYVFNEEDIILIKNTIIFTIKAWITIVFLVAYFNWQCDERFIIPLVFLLWLAPSKKFWIGCKEIIFFAKCHTLAFAKRMTYLLIFLVFSCCTVDSFHDFVTKTESKVTGEYPEPYNPTPLEKYIVNAYNQKVISNYIHFLDDHAARVGYKRGVTNFNDIKKPR